MEDDERINRMKMCTLCLDSPEYPYQEIDAILHERSGTHHTVRNGTIYHWQPVKGHPLFEQHKRALALLTPLTETS